MIFSCLVSLIPRTKNTVFSKFLNRSCLNWPTTQDGAFWEFKYHLRRIMCMYVYIYIYIYIYIFVCKLFLKIKSYPSPSICQSVKHYFLASKRNPHFIFSKLLTATSQKKKQLFGFTSIIHCQEDPTFIVSVVSFNYLYIYF